MATLAQLCLFSIFLFPLKNTIAEPICDTMSCGEIQIRFPFGLKGANQNPRCSYPRFQLSCNNRNKTILTLPDSGDLVVKSLDYEKQTVKVNDPEGCLPDRFLHNLSHSLPSPFAFDDTVYELTFFGCPSNISETYRFPPISCLSDSGPNSSVTFFSWWTLGDTSPWGQECEVISTAMVPIPNDARSAVFWPDLNSDVDLKWNEPACGECVARGQRCGFIGDTGIRVGCFSGSQNESQGLSRSAKYGLTIGVGIPGLLCLIGLCCLVCNKFNTYTHRRQARPSSVLPSSLTTLQLPSFIMGLDGPEIEKFPKTLIGDSGRLPNSNDNTCPICLSEYEPKETLRTIPTCNHYFHARCIDEWLKMNATCPLCRNSQDASSTVSVTPSSSSLSIYSSSP